MLKKQDRQGARRPADIEQKYKFNKQFSETRTAIKESQAVAAESRAVAEEARRIASDISETDKGLSLKVEALGKDVNGVKAQLDLKVETDENGNLKSRVHVSGNEFTVDTDNFKLDEEGNVGITGTFNTKSNDGAFETKINGGIIYVDAPYMVYAEGERHQYLLMTFRSYGGKRMGLYAYGTLDKNLEFVFEGLRVDSIEPEQGEEI